MGKSKKKKNKDFQKVKLKVGRKLQRTNETKIDLQMKQIVLQTQKLEPRSSKHTSQPNLMKQLESIKSEDRLQCLKLLKQILDQTVNDCEAENDVSSSSLDDKVPIMWLTPLLKRFCFDSNPEVVRDSVTCCVAIIKLLKCSELQSILYDSCSDLVRFLLASSKQPVRYEGVRLLNCLLNHLPVIFHHQLRPTDATLTLIAINKFCWLEIKSDVLPRDDLELILSCVAKILSQILQPDTDHQLLNNVPSIDLSDGSGAMPSVKRYQCAQMANHEWSHGARICGDYRRFTDDEFQQSSNFNLSAFCERCIPWISIVENRLREEDLSVSSLICYSHLCQTLLCLSKYIRLTPLTEVKTSNLYMNVIENLLRNVFPVQLNYENLLKMKASRPLFHTKSAYNDFVLSVNVTLIQLAASNDRFLSSQIDRIVSFVKLFLFGERHGTKESATKHLLSLSEENVLQVLKCVESVLISDSTSPNSHKLCTNLQDLVYSVHIRAAVESLGKRWAAVVLTRAFKYRSQYGSLDALCNRSCYQKLPSSLKQSIRKSPNAQVSSTFLRALYELQSLGLTQALSVYKELIRTMPDCLYLDKFFPAII